MTSRERMLVAVLAGVTATAVILFTASSWWDETARLEEEFQNLKSQANRILQRAIDRPVDGGLSRDLFLWESLLWPEGEAPTILAFSSTVQRVAREARLTVIGFKVSEEKPGKAWVQFQLEGAISSWFVFLDTLGKADPRALFRDVTIKKDTGETYTYTCEVGFATRP